jgi:SAM-dependent methyltransferase
MTTSSHAGFVDQIEVTRIAGWIAAPEAAARVTIYVNGNAVGVAAGGVPRPDAEAAGYLGARAFDFDPGRFLVQGENLIQVAFEGSRYMVPNGQASLHLTATDRIAQHWSTVYKQKTDLVVRWWESDYVVRHINRNVCGESLSGLSSGLHQLALNRLGACAQLGRGISVGGGTGSKEIDLLRRGLVRQMVIYDLSPQAIITGRQHATAAGLTDRMTFVQDDAFKCETGPDAYDLVYWNNALHHMPDVGEALRWSRRVLRTGGLLLMDDFVGPTRMQWSQRLLDINNIFLRSLPPEYFRHPSNPHATLSRAVHRPDVSYLISVDPSECVDSARILPELARHFPEADVTPTGGGIYLVGLNDVLHNIVAAGDTATLDRMMDLDRACADLGETNYATAMAIKVDLDRRAMSPPSGASGSPERALS